MNDTTFQGDGRVAYVPVVVSAKKQPKTNGDRIRSMTDEELAEFINDTEYGFIERPGMCDVCDHHRIRECLKCWFDWLKQEASDGEDLSAVRR